MKQKKDQIRRKDTYSQSVADDWVRLYQTEGTQAFLPRTGNRRYDPVLKEAAVNEAALIQSILHDATVGRFFKIPIDYRPIGS